MLRIAAQILAPMDRMVKAHIADLERMLLELNDELMEQDDLQLRNTLEARARAAEQALEHLHAALPLVEKARQRA